MNIVRLKELRDGVERGAAQFDKVRPGWWKAISLEMLDMNNCERCIAGQQVFDLCSLQRAPWAEIASSALVLEDPEPEYYGLEARWSREDAILERLWAAVIRARSALA